MPDFGIFRGFNSKLFSDKLFAGQLPTQLGLIGSLDFEYLFLLDDYPTAAAAYSLRKLRSAYTGSAIRVRRSSDNDEQNIGFVNNVLDTASLTSFCGSGNGFVTTWYDQSGNARNATQTTASRQPKIYDSSTGLINENGKPSINFIAANLCRLDSSANWDYTTTFTVTRFYTRPSFAYIYTSYNTTGKLISDVNGSGYRIYSNALLYANVNPSLTNQDLIYGLFNSFSSQIKVDNNSVVTGDSGIFTASGVTIGIAGNNIADSAFNGTMQELIFYPSNQSSNRTGIETNINNFYSIY